ncbi:DNA-binding protein [Saccharothrix lopnurensis]|uniref:DNA-binding protein n=1 Tax=Saccharothrix lopnurensis TaxID=1670621 RepID=A0ABW1P2W9_9PSEU
MTASNSNDRSMRQDELLALPAAVPLDTANRALGLSRSRGYELAKHGEYPVRVLPIGRGYRVPTADLWAVLGVTAPQETAAAQEEEAAAPGMA